jgi:zinc/manganese transport system substrate-binding protein
VFRSFSLALVSATVGLVGCSGDDKTDATPTVVVTYSALESLLEGIVGEAARVEVIVPNGTDPHNFSPSAKVVEALSSAALIVANGLDFEEGLEDAIKQAGKSGVPVFRLADHVELRDGDPHVWLDPATIAEAVPSLTQQLTSALGEDLQGRGSAVGESLTNLDEKIMTTINALESCVLITGHDSLGYFGARYGCEVLGSVVPNFSTAAEATAKNLSELKALAESEGVKAIFTELGTPADVAERLADELGVDVVEIATHLVPDGGGYDEMMLALVDAIVSGLS